ncbi:MAG: metallo-beta-lactamase [Anaerolineales bacterium]|jgi:metallo-beta-lactamase class B
MKTKRIIQTLRWILILGFLVGCAPKTNTHPLALSVDSETFIEITPDLKVRYIQEGVFEITHSYPWEANSLAVVMGDYLVLVDTPWTPQATQEMLAWLKTQVGSKQIVAINTHYHLDNLGGNQYLVEQGIPVYGSDLTVELLRERGQASLDQTLAWLQSEEDPRFAETLSKLELTPPSEIFKLQEGLNLTFAGESVQVYYPGPAHSPDNVVVYFPERKLLFGGCMIIGWEAIGNTADANLQAWPASVRNLSQFEFEIVVPGHGERLDPGLIDHTLALLEGQNT